jgi:hypothetical protein
LGALLIPAPAAKFYFGRVVETPRFEFRSRRATTGLYPSARQTLFHLDPFAEVAPLRKPQDWFVCAARPAIFNELFFLISAGRAEGLKMPDKML